MLPVFVLKVISIGQSYPGTSPEHVKDRTQGNDQQDDYHQERITCTLHQGVSQEEACSTNKSLGGYVILTSSDVPLDLKAIGQQLWLQAKYHDILVAARHSCFLVTI